MKTSTHLYSISFLSLVLLAGLGCSTEASSPSTNSPGGSMNEVSEDLIEPGESIVPIETLQYSVTASEDNCLAGMDCTEVIDMCSVVDRYADAIAIFELATTPTAEPYECTDKRAAPASNARLRVLAVAAGRALPEEIDVIAYSSRVRDGLYPGRPFLAPLILIGDEWFLGPEIGLDLSGEGLGANVIDGEGGVDLRLPNTFEDLTQEATALINDPSLCNHGYTRQEWEAKLTTPRETWACDGEAYLRRQHGHQEPTMQP